MSDELHTSDPLLPPILKPEDAFFNHLLRSAVHEAKPEDFVRRYIVDCLKELMAEDRIRQDIMSPAAKMLIKLAHEKGPVE